MLEKDNIFKENEKQANKVTAKVMGTTFLLFTLVYILNLCGIFVVEHQIMTGAYIAGSVLLLLPAVHTYLLKTDKPYVKYSNVIGAALFVAVLSATLTYHVVVIYVYPIAIASLYFSKKMNILATVFTVAGVSIGQVIAFFADTVQDKNFTVFKDTIIWGILPRSVVLIAVAIIFTMLCERTVKLLTSLFHAVSNISRYHREMVMGFATLVENKDGSTGGHIKRTTSYVELLANELKQRGHYAEILTEEYIKNLCMAAPMHDIGKISVPDLILQKPGRLDAEEFEIIKTHATRGGEIIRETFGHLENEAYTQMAYEVARFHHEKWNGNGYPEGLKKNDIPLCARIMAVADVFDAVSEKRCYRDAMPLDKCFDIIQDGSGTDFDPIVAEVFLDIRDKVQQVHEVNNK